MATGPVTSTLSATPIPSTRQARAKLRSLPQRRPSQAQKATEGTAASPTTSQTRPSRAAISGVLRTMVEMKVAVIT